MISSGLLAWWPLHSADGEATDYSGNGHDGTIGGGVTGTAAGLDGLEAYYFEPSAGNARVAVPFSDDFNFNGAMTISLWYNAKENPDGMLYFGDSNTDVTFQVFCDPDVQLLWANNNNNRTTTAGPGRDGPQDEWIHVLWTIEEIDGEYIVKSYRNGEFFTRNTFTDAPHNATDGDDLLINEGLYFGEQRRGLLRDVRLYKRVLSSAEVSRMYDNSSAENNVATPPEDGVARYAFDDRSPENYNYATDTFDDNTLNTSLWQDTTPGSGTVAEQNQQLELLPSGNNDGRPYFEVNRSEIFGLGYYDIEMEFDLRLNSTSTDLGYAQILPWWSGAYKDTTFYDSDEAIQMTIRTDNEVNLFRREPSGDSAIDSGTITDTTTWNSYTVSLNGDPDSFEYTVSVNGTELFSGISGITSYDFSKTAITTREKNADVLIDNLSINYTEPRATDSYGAIDGILNGVTFSSDSIRGLSTAYDGSNEYISTGTDYGLTIAEPFTVSAWFNTDNISSNRRILGLYDGSDDIFYIGHNTNDYNFRIGHVGGNELNVSTGITQAEASWNLSTLTWDPSINEITFYLNGRIVYRNQSPIDDPFDSTETLDIGRRSDDSQYWNGKLDDVRIYDRALDPKEVYQLYLWGTGGRDMRDNLVNAR